MKIVRFLPLLGVVLAGIVLVYALEKPTSVEISPLAGQPVPAFSLINLLEGEPSEGTFSVPTVDQSLLQGKMQLLNVWASWCGVCKKEHSFLLELQQQGMSIVGLNYRDKRSSAVATLTEEGNPYRAVIYDPLGELALDLGVYGTPETMLIDPKGIIRQRYVGAMDEAIWQQQFAPVVETIKLELLEKNAQQQG
ncbi:DsbE family thiol:disulfide interchange protein [Photobacterium sanguinicancri]|uniref:DsbE family thiol:disulfide interchange protein n=1 Tax=Photobacterium sanguinicancri TaxID=875932 RepID=UPI0026E23EE2|nr:DsbE family thiol:disulfide interchange protein [Photobacterium sanguinicancri]MDO6498520.1 DsbE family thiol:disulfide interchange protein [Photobacterium sanguinicancri]